MFEHARNLGVHVLCKSVVSLRVRIAATRFAKLFNAFIMFESGENIRQCLKMTS